MITARNKPESSRSRALMTALILTTAFAVTHGAFSLVLKTATARPPTPQTNEFSIAPLDADKDEEDSGTTLFTFTVDRGNWNLTEKALVTYSVKSLTLSECAGHDFPTRIVSRNFYYRGSLFEQQGNVDDAIASDKTPLISGNASFLNYTSYIHGITGIVIDIENGTGVTPVSGDFEFRTGTKADLSTWTPAPAPAIEFLDGGNVDGTHRVLLKWPEDTIRNAWLEIRVKANANTGLAVDDVSYFGNAVCESGDNPANTRVNLVDVGLTRVNQTGFSSAPVDNDFDFNRDKKVNLVDVGRCRKNQTGFTTLPLISLPTGLSGGFCFDPNEQTRTLTIDVVGDEIAELDDEFEVTLISAVSSSGENDTIVNATATGVIRNDDGRTADVIFIIDDSASMEFAHSWLAEDVLDAMAAKFTDEGLCENRFGMISFEDDVTPYDFGVNDFWVNTAQIEDIKRAIRSLRQLGTTENGQQAIGRALGLGGTEYVFRPHAVVNVILVTDDESTNFTHLAQTAIDAVIDASDNEVIFTTISSTAFTADEGDGSQDNREMFSNKQGGQWTTGNSALKSMAGAGGNYIANDCVSVDLVDQYSSTNAMCNIDRRKDGNPVFDLPINDESWTIDSKFVIGNGGGNRNVRIHFSDLALPNWNQTEFLNIEADTGICSLSGTTFIKHNVNAPWPTITIGATHEVELRMVVSPLNQTNAGEATQGRFDLFVDQLPVGSLAVTFASMPQAHDIKSIGLGHNMSETSFDYVQFRIRKEDNYTDLQPETVTPGDYSTPDFPFKRAYSNSFGSTSGNNGNGNSWGIPIDVEGNYGIMGINFDGFAYQYVSTLTPTRYQLLGNPDHVQSKRNSAVHYLALADKTSGAAWNLEMLRRDSVGMNGCVHGPTDELYEGFTNAFVDVFLENISDVLNN